MPIRFNRFYKIIIHKSNLFFVVRLELFQTFPNLHKRSVSIHEPRLCDLPFCMSRHEWFKESLTYWSEQDASVDGMLGGYGRLHLPDIRDSRAFLLHCYSPLFERFHQNNRISPRNKHVDDKITMTKGKQKLSLALDVGAGIGRISEHLLLPHFERVSLLESDPRFCEVAKGRLNMDNINNSQLSSEDKIYRIHCCRLQEFTPSEEEMQTHRYDLIWIQWVLSYASDGIMLIGWVFV